MKSIFTGIVILSVVSYAAWFFMPLIWEYLYDYEILNRLQWDGYGGKINISGPIPYLFGIAYLICSFGLVLFKNWARTLFLILTIINVFSAPLWGMSVQGSYDTIPGYIVSLCDGAILSLAYLSGISSEFTQST